MNTIKDKTEIQIEGKNFIFPIMEYEKIAFFIVVDRMNLNIFNFIEQVTKKYLCLKFYLSKNFKCSRLWNYISHILKILKERQLFLSLLEQDDSKLVLMFNYNKNLIYQSKDIPANLKFFLIKLIKQFVLEISLRFLM